MPLTPTQQQAMERRNRALVTVAKSMVIHPDWTEDEHLSYLENDAFVIDSPDQTLAIVQWPAGYQEFPAWRFVRSWCRQRERVLAEGARLNRMAVA